MSTDQRIRVTIAKDPTCEQLYEIQNDCARLEEELKGKKESFLGDIRSAETEIREIN